MLQDECLVSQCSNKFMIFHLVSDVSIHRCFSNLTNSLICFFPTFGTLSCFVWCVFWPRLFFLLVMLLFFFKSLVLKAVTSFRLLETETAAFIL